MRLVYLLFFVFLSNFLKGQGIEKYYFEIENKVIVDSASGIYYGQINEFNVLRKYKNYRKYKEKGVFNSNSFTKFKKRNNKWFIKKGLRWRLLCPINLNEKIKIKLMGRDIYLEYKEKDIIYGIESLIFKTYSENNVSFNIRYWFSDKYGIIKIENDNHTFIRSDIKEKHNH